MNKSQFSIIISAFWLIAALISVIAAAYFLRNILMLVFLSFILASALHPGVRLGRRFKVPAPVSILSMFVVLFVVISILLSFVIPPLVTQSVQFLNTATKMVGIREVPLDGVMTLNLEQIAQQFDRYGGLLNQFTGSIQAAVSVITSTFSILFIFITWLVVTSHMLMSIDHIAGSFAWLAPGDNKKEKAQFARDVLEEIMHQLGSWLRGQLLLMIIVGVVTYIGLYLLGVPYALPLAIIAGFLEIVPNLGPTIASIPAIAAAFLLVNPLTGFFTILFYIIVQQLENNLIVPQIMKNAVDVHPLTTIVLMLIGFQSMGVVGALGILPLYITARTLIRHLFPERGPFSDYSRALKKTK